MSSRYTSYLQRATFNAESVEHGAGSNASIYVNNNYVLYKQNPRYDFIKEQRLGTFTLSKTLTSAKITYLILLISYL